MRLLITFKIFSIIVVSFNTAIEIGIGKNVQTNFCPVSQYVSKVEFSRLPDSRYNISVECQQFLPADAAAVSPEECNLKDPFPLDSSFTLGWNDYFRQCRCDEYLAGIEMYTANWNGTWVTNETGKEVNIIQLRCCMSSNKEQWPPSCVYSGMENLMAPWNVSSLGVRSTEKIVGRNYAIQTLMIRGNFINARICDYNVVYKNYTLPTVGIRSCWSGVDWDCVDNLDQGSVCRADDAYSMYGWSDDSLVYNNANAVVSFRPGVTYKRQFQMCRSGYRLHTITKRSTDVQNSHSKDYSFDIKCAPMASRSCYCLWMDSCPKDFYFGHNMWYVAGIRTSVNESIGENVEVLCCQSGSMAINNCRMETISKDEPQSTISVGDQMFTYPLNNQTSLNIIRNIESSYANGILNMRFNICSIIYHYDWCYHEPCFWCRTRAYRDGMFIGGGGFWSANGPIAGSSARLGATMGSANIGQMNSGSLSSVDALAAASSSSLVSGSNSGNGGSLGGAGFSEGASASGTESSNNGDGFNSGGASTGGDSFGSSSGGQSINGDGDDQFPDGDYDYTNGGSSFNQMQSSGFNNGFQNGGDSFNSMQPGLGSGFSSGFNGIPMSSGFGGGFPMSSGFGGGFPMASGFGGGFPMSSGFGGGFPMASGFGGGFPMTSGFGGGFPMSSGFGGGFPMLIGTPLLLPMGTRYVNHRNTYMQYDPSVWQSWSGWSQWDDGCHAGFNSMWVGQPWNGGYSSWSRWRNRNANNQVYAARRWRQWQTSSSVNNAIQTQQQQAVQQQGSNVHPVMPTGLVNPVLINRIQNRARQQNGGANSGASGSFNSNGNINNNAGNNNGHGFGTNVNNGGVNGNGHHHHHGDGSNSNFGSSGLSTGMSKMSHGNGRSDDSNSKSNEKRGNNNNFQKTASSKSSKEGGGSKQAVGQAKSGEKNTGAGFGKSASKEKGQTKVIHKVIHHNKENQNNNNNNNNKNNNNGESKEQKQGNIGSSKETDKRGGGFGSTASSKSSSKDINGGNNDNNNRENGFGGQSKGFGQSKENNQNNNGHWGKSKEQKQGNTGSSKETDKRGGGFGASSKSSSKDINGNNNDNNNRGNGFGGQSKGFGQSKENNQNNNKNIHWGESKEQKQGNTGSSKGMDKQGGEFGSRGNGKGNSKDVNGGRNDNHGNGFGDHGGGGFFEQSKENNQNNNNWHRVKSSERGQRQGNAGSSKGAEKRGGFGSASNTGAIKASSKDVNGGRNDINRGIGFGGGQNKASFGQSKEVNQNNKNFRWGESEEHRRGSGGLNGNRNSQGNVENHGTGFGPAPAKGGNSKGIDRGKNANARGNGFGGGNGFGDGNQDRNNENENKKQNNFRQPNNQSPPNGGSLFGQQFNKHENNEHHENEFHNGPGVINNNNNNKGNSPSNQGFGNNNVQRNLNGEQHHETNVHQPHSEATPNIFPLIPPHQPSNPVVPAVLPHQPVNPVVPVQQHHQPNPVMPVAPVQPVQINHAPEPIHVMPVQPQVHVAPQPQVHVAPQPQVHVAPQPQVHAAPHPQPAAPPPAKQRG